MNLSKIELQSFVMAELNTYDLNGLGINNEIAKKEIEAKLLEELKDLNSNDTKQARLDYFKIKGATKEDYSEKRLNIKNSKKVIYGIRNMGDNPDIPFIQLRPNFELSSKEESLEIYELIKEEFKVFEPLYLSFQAIRKIDADFYGSVHMVTKIHKLTAKEAWDLEELISFESIADNSYYNWYKKSYDDFHADFPELKTKVIINSASSMKDSLEQGLLKFVNFDGERIGLIAGEKNSFLGHTGLYFHEIYISKKWKGKGLAKAIQRKFIQDFCNELEFVWGTIDSTNLPSYKTAYSNGRRPIRHECFINLK